MSPERKSKPDTTDASLAVARSYLEQAGFDQVPDAHTIASEPEWLLKVAAVVVLRNLPKMIKSGVKDTAKILVDIASGGVRAGSTGDSLAGLDEKIAALLRPDDASVVDDDIVGGL